MVVGGQDYSIAGKTFESISMQKPIIGFVAEGAQIRILARTGMAVICDPDDTDGSDATLKKLISGEWQAQPDTEFLNSLHRRTLTGKLANINETAIRKSK